MAEVKLNFLWMGITGEGKSAAGNTILNKYIFKEGINTMSETKDVSFSFTQFKNYLLLVVDGPGLADTELSEAEDRETTAKNMDQALAMCYGGVDAFLLVIKFPNRFTKQNISAVHDLKTIFGDRFMEHVIVVVTCGDRFESEMKHEKRVISFDEWCRAQKGAFRQLYDDCEKRVVLFNNREEDEEKKRAQVQQIVQLAESLHARFGDRYTSECFRNAESEREKLILKYNAPYLNETIQAEICLLNESINNLIKRPEEEAKQKIKERVQKVKREIEKHDKGHGVLQNLLELAGNVEDSLDDVDKLITLNHKLEETRQAKEKWCKIGSVCSVASGAICAVAPSVGLAVSATCAAATTINTIRLVSNEKDIEKKKQKIQNKRLGKSERDSNRDK